MSYLLAYLLASVLPYLFTDSLANLLIYLLRHSGLISAISFTSNDLLVTTSHDGTAKIWNLNGECLKTLIGHTDRINALAVTPENVIITASRDGTAKLWGVE